MTNSRNCTTVQEKDTTQLVIRDTSYNREQTLKMMSILERPNTLKTTALRSNEVARGARYRLPRLQEYPKPFASQGRIAPNSRAGTSGGP